MQNDEPKIKPKHRRFAEARFRHRQAMTKKRLRLRTKSKNISKICLLRLVLESWNPTKILETKSWNLTIVAVGENCWSVRIDAPPADYLRLFRRDQKLQIISNTCVSTSEIENVQKNLSRRFKARLSPERTVLKVCFVFEAFESEAFIDHRLP